jgi:hypothetical protein
VQLQKSSGGVWSRISSAYAQQKLRQGRVNGDLARSERRWVKPSTGTAGERSVAVPANTRENGKVRTKTHGGARVPSSGRPIARKAVCRSRDRGCSGHRILRRVPADGRHPGSHEVSAFTRRCSRWSWRVSASSDPLQPVKTRASGQDKEAGNVGEARRSAEDVTRDSRQGCQRLGRLSVVGRKRPRSCLQPARD